MIRFRRALVLRLLAGGVVSLAAVRSYPARPTAPEPPDPLQLGRVEFPTSGRPAAQPHFLRGVAALHSFWYEEALESFAAALEIDPDFAMARWGVAMTHKRPFVPGSDEAAGRRALAQIRDRSALPARERAYVDALAAWYAEGPPAARARAYAVAMRQVHRAYPDDPEAAVFYALSLIGQGWPDEDFAARHAAAGEVAEAVYRRIPAHPGAAHYLIHSLDDPELAARALEPARHYARIAPAAPHALHMPSHIFLQLGLWRETTEANESAWRASETWVRRRQLSPTLRDYHNYHWLIYSCLQQGRHARAAELVNAFRGMRKDMRPEHLFFFEKAAAAFVVETRNWEGADALFAGGPAEPAARPPRPTGAAPLELCGGTSGTDAERGPAGIPAFIRTLAAAARGAPDTARRLAELRDTAGGDQAMPEFWRIRVLEVTALQQAHEGNFAAALAALREATAIEEELGKPPGPPAAYKPPHELFGEILLQAGQPAEAAAQFAKNLLLHPNRALSVLGRARAEAAGGDRVQARDTYARLLEIWRDADADLPEVREAREYLHANPR